MENVCKDNNRLSDITEDDIVTLKQFKNTELKAKKLQTKNLDKINKLNDKISVLEKTIEDISSVLYKFKVNDFIIDTTDGTIWEIMSYDVPKHSGMLYQTRKVNHRYAMFTLMNRYKPKYNEIKFFNNDNIVKLDDIDTYIDILLDIIKKHNIDKD